MPRRFNDETRSRKEITHTQALGMAEALAVRNQEAISSQLAYIDFLELLLEDELNKRRDRLFSRRLKAARIRK